MSTSTMPPANSAHLPRYVPQRLPRRIHIYVITSAARPINRAGRQMVSPIRLKLTPTASASRLVATDSPTKLQPLVGSNPSARRSA